MSTYVIGDIHGCMSHLTALLKCIDYRPERDRLVLTGDLVNRGPASGQVLRWAYANRIDTVLGNHELYLLARAQGIREPLPGDRLDEILCADDRGPMLAWLRTRPFLLDIGSHLVVHAGLHPHWTLSQAKGLANALPHKLDSDREFLARVLAQDHDTVDFEHLCGSARLAQAARIFSMIRDCDSHGRPRLSADQPPGSYSPWFRQGLRRSQPVCFGHAARLGPHSERNATCVDSGCGFGGALTAYRTDDGRWFQSGTMVGSPAGP